MGNFLLGREMSVFGLHSGKPKPGRKQEGWDGGVLSPASCPPVISSLLIPVPLSWQCPALVSCPGPPVVQLPGMGRERGELHRYHPRVPTVGVQPWLVPSCPLEADLVCQAGAVLVTTRWDPSVGASQESVRTRNLAQMR